MPPPADLRVLEGANRWFPGPAVQLTLDARALAEMPVGEAAAVAERAALPGRAAPGPPGSDRRLRFATTHAALPPRPERPACPSAAGPGLEPMR
jgi:hypothetical protein